MSTTIDELATAVKSLEKRVAVAEAKTAEAVEALGNNEKVIEDFAVMFSEHVATLDGRMEELGNIFISKLKKKAPMMES